MLNNNQSEVAGHGDQTTTSDAEAPTVANFQQATVSNSVDQAQMVSGIGQYHTNEYDPDKPDKKLTPYVTVSWPEIVAMAKNPRNAPANTVLTIR